MHEPLDTSRNRIFPRLLTVLLLTSLATVASAKPPAIDSRWRDRDVFIDGTADEWSDARTWFKKQKIDVGVLNDGQYLYVSVVTEDSGVRSQIMMQGLTIWLGGTDEAPSFGLRYPIGMRAAMEATGNDMSSLRGDPSMRRQMMDEMLDTVEVLEEGAEEGQRYTVEASGIDVKVEFGQRRVVYEARIPLTENADHELAAGLKSGENITFGLVSPELEREEGARVTFQGPGGSRGVGRGGAGGGGFGRGGGSRGGGVGSGAPGGGRGGPPGGSQDGRERRSPPKPFDIWTTVQLATPSQ